MNYKTNCERISSELIPYLDGRANAAEQSAVESHAAVCPACRERIEEFRKLLYDKVIEIHTARYPYDHLLY